MAYRLAPNLSFCMSGGEPYFLDLERDRYFRLSGKLGSAFIAFVTNAEEPPPEIESLVERRVLERTTGSAAISPVAVEIPTRSIIEESRPADAGSLRFVPEVGARLAGIGLERRLFRFSESIRRRRETAPERHDEIGARRFALQYEAARRLVPARSRCLPDSLALFDFLTARKQRARIVFGIRREPFAAHCWVQTERALLNERADIAAGFQPIFIAP